MTLSLDQFEQAVHRQFAFLIEEFGFRGPIRKDLDQRYRHVAYERSNLALEFAVETPDFLPWWTTVRLINGEYPSSYAVDELGRKRKLFSHHITRAILPHLNGAKPVLPGRSFDEWGAAEADYLRRHARYFLNHSDSVFEQIDRDRQEPPKRKLL